MEELRAIVGAYNSTQIWVEAIRQVSETFRMLMVLGAGVYVSHLFKDKIMKKSK